MAAWADAGCVDQLKIADGFLDSVLACANRTTGDVQELCDSIWCTGEEGEVLDETAIRRGMEDVFAKESLRRAEMPSAATAKRAIDRLRSSAGAS